MLSLEMERFFDEVIMSDRALRKALTGKPPHIVTLGEKLMAVCQSMGYSDLVPDVELVVRYRNVATHGSSGAISASSAELFLEAAERIVSRLSA